MSARVAYALPPDQADLERLAPLWPLVDLFEVCPETTWWCDGDGTLRPNGYHRRFRELARAHGKKLIAHGVAFSLGSASPDPRRRRRWLDRIAADQETFQYEWYSDHFGVTEVAGELLQLPLPLPAHGPERTAAIAATRASLAALQTVIADVGCENSAFYATTIDPAEQAQAIAACVAAPRTWLVLDLHNLHVMATNAGLALAELLAGLPLDRVIELHLAGGRATDPGWLASRRVLRLDSHDAAVPEAVFAAAEAVAPFCPNLRAVTLERMEGTLRDGDVERLAAELRRTRAIAENAGSAAVAVAPTPARGDSTPGERRDAADASAFAALARHEAALAAVLRDPEPPRAWAALPAGRATAFASWGADGIELAALLIARLRFERLSQGSPAARAWFERDPAGFAAAFRRFHASCPPRGGMAQDEGRAFADWQTAAAQRSSPAGG